MKNIILFVSLFISLSGTSQLIQDSTNQRHLKYDTAIVIPLNDKYELKRTATFQGFFYNLEMQTLSLRWRIHYFKGSEPITLFGKQYEDREQIADASVFVNMEGALVDTTTYPGPFISEIDFYKLIANRGTGHQNATINQLIIQAGLKPGKWKE
jgi:hypothetical protein